MHPFRKSVKDLEGKFQVAMEACMRASETVREWLPEEGPFLGRDTGVREAKTKRMIIPDRVC